MSPFPCIISGMNSFEPWQKFPDLTSERLITIANIIRSVRHDTVCLHDPEHGDGPWSLGCRAYERICFGIEEAAKDYEWLHILQKIRNLEFSFAIGSIPFRFYRGTPDEPPDNYQFKTFGELRHLQLCLEIDGLPPIDNILRLAIETDAVTREVSRVTLVEMNSAGEPTGVWEIPDESTATNVIPIQTPPIDLPPAVATPIVASEQEQEGEQADGIGSAS